MSSLFCGGFLTVWVIRCLLTCLFARVAYHTEHYNWQVETPIAQWWQHRWNGGKEKSQRELRHISPSLSHSASYTLSVWWGFLADESRLCRRIIYSSEGSHFHSTSIKKEKKFCVLCKWKNNMLAHGCKSAHIVTTSDLVGDVWLCNSSLKCVITNRTTFFIFSFVWILHPASPLPLQGLLINHTDNQTSLAICPM